MFDTKAVGKKIMSLRKKKNLTQMQLANEMGVSFQAVSNWERGCSMPDISNLPDLAIFLDVSIDELLGHSNETKIVKAIIEEEPNIKASFDEIKEIAPILSPEKVDEIYQQNVVPENSRLSELAPFLSGDYLDDKIKSMDLKALDYNLIPFVSDQTLEKIFEQLLEIKEYEPIVRLAPFMKTHTLNCLILENLNDFKSLRGLYPFISNQVKDKLVDVMLLEDEHTLLKEMVPFLSNDKIGELMDKEVVEIFELLPFASQDKLNQCAEDYCTRGDMASLRKIVPFLSTLALEKAITSSTCSIQDLSPIYPFLSKQFLHRKLSNKES